MSDDDLAPLLTAQLSHYRARADEYLADVLGLHAISELDAALTAFRPIGDALELACGPAIWTQRLLEHATTVTAVDAAPQMLAIARARVTDDRARFIQADLFDWRPSKRFDVVFFGFWLSHVPLERLAASWRLLDGCLTPVGRVFFVDDAHRTPDELIEGAASSTIRRRVSDGMAYRAVEVPHTTGELQARLALLGRDVRVRPAGGAFYWGAGERAEPNVPSDVA